MGLSETNHTFSNLLLESFWSAGMNRRIVATFDPERLQDNRYTLLFENLRGAGFDVDVLPHPDPEFLDDLLDDYKQRLEGASMVIHIPAFFFAWADGNYENTGDGDRDMNFYLAPTTDPEKVRRLDFKRKLEDTVRSLADSGTILDADVYLSDESEVYTTLDEMDIPRINRTTVEEWEANKTFPVVFKMKGTSQGHGIYHIETDDQFRKLFDKDYIIPAENAPSHVRNNFRSGRFSDSRDYFDVSEFIECPSDHFTHYRVFTLGDGTIMGAVLSYSGLRKSDDERVALDDMNIGNVYDDVKSPLFLNRKKVVSNKGNGGNQIPLNPTEQASTISDYETEILAQHGITDQQIPLALEDQARRTALKLGEKGLYVLGQDWIQGKDEKFYCLEVNAGPQFGIFDTLYNQGREDDEAAQRIATQKITEGIVRHLSR